MKTFTRKPPPAFLVSIPIINGRGSRVRGTGERCLYPLVLANTTTFRLQFLQSKRRKRRRRRK
jgi:hypothetical protein